MRKLFICMLIFGLFGCSSPKVQFRPVLQKPSLAFENVPKGAMLNIDGLYIHNLHRYDGENMVLSVDAGQHEIIVENQEGKRLYAETIVVGNYLKVVDIEPKK